MKLKEIIDESKNYEPSIFLDHYLNRRLRTILEYLLLFLSIGFFSSSFIEFRNYSYNTLPDGLFFISIFLLINLLLVRFFYTSSKFSKSKISFVSASIVLLSDEFDLTGGFLNSKYSHYLMSRLGIGREDIKSFINSQRKMIQDPLFNVESDFVDFAEYANAIYKNDESFASFMSSHEVNFEDFYKAALWVNSEIDNELKKERWWSKENLDTVPSIGTSLSYGNVDELSKYAIPIEKLVPVESFGYKDNYREKEIIQVENALTRTNEANAIVVDNDETVVKDIVARFSKKIKEGKVSSNLEHRIIFELDWNNLLASKKTKYDFEQEYLKILSECVTAGNVILYIPNLPSFISGARKIGVNLNTFMEEYLVSPLINIIAHATKTDFYYFIEMNPGLGRVFERIVPSEKGVESAMPVILEKARFVEKDYNGKLFFTYPALREISELADKFIAYGEMPTKAVDMLFEIAPWALREGLKIIYKRDIDLFVSSKTGIASGQISESESGKLSKLEEILHQRIVGQDEAVNAISSAMRRGRVGIGNPKKPIASFLFLGPTGVGKTETAKALAESFFGNEDKMVRLDMSEYNGVDATPRLIGSFSEGKAGVLSSKIRENPYGVILLDEFEKAAPDILNLFLRILDEGKFTDAFSGEISARNNIIIATSNAGSEMIWKAVRSGDDLNKKKAEIVDHLIDNHIFKPELLNRFDAIVIYKPLQGGELRDVAQMMLSKFIDRLKKDKQIEINPSKELVDYIVLHGESDDFGARSIGRVMQEKIEDAIAKKIINKELRAGSKIDIGIKDVMR